MAWWRGPWWGFGWGYKWGWRGPWPGRGPFSYLPPWQRPGWIYGPGACWRIFGVPGWLAYYRWTAPYWYPPVYPPYYY